jgi:predicted Zn-dependent peptidase
MRELRAGGEDWEREVGVIAAERELLATRQDHLWPEDLRRTTFPISDPYHHPVLGSERLPTIGQARAFHARNYSPDNCVVSVTGAVDAEAVAENLQACFGSVPLGQPRRRPAPVVWADPPTRTDLDASDDVTRVYLAWPAPAWATKTYWALSLWGYVLVAGRRAVLADLAVPDGRIVDYGFQLLRWRRAPLFVVWAEAEAATPDQLEEALREALLAAGPPSAEAVARACRMTTVEEACTAEEAGERALVLADALAHGVSGDGLMPAKAIDTDLVVTASSLTTAPPITVLRYTS